MEPDTCNDTLQNQTMICVKKTRTQGEDIYVNREFTFVNVQFAGQSGREERQDSVSANAHAEGMGMRRYGRNTEG